MGDLIQPFLPLICITVTVSALQRSAKIFSTVFVSHHGTMSKEAVFALVYWLDDGLFSFVRCSDIQAENYEIGDDVVVAWVMKKKKGKCVETKWFKARILELSGKYATLYVHVSKLCLEIDIKLNSSSLNYKRIPFRDHI